MSAPAFTAGPWLIHAKRRWIVPAEDAFAEPADALPICQLRDPDERLAEDATLANGFLIAAAPELYEALEAVTIFAASTIEKLNLTDTNDIIAAANTALAKARGDHD